MQLNEPLEQPGHFWLPDQKEEQIRGTLRIEQSGRAYLDLFDALYSGSHDPSQPTLNPGSRTSFPRSRPYDRIHGRILDGAVTLDRCTPIRSNRSLTGGISRSTLAIGRTYIGAWYEEGETPSFSRLVISMTGLHEWLLLSGLTGEAEYNNGTITRVMHTFEPPPEIIAHLPDGTELAFGLSWSDSGIGPDSTEAIFTQEARLAVRRQSPVPLDQHLDTSLRFQRLLSLAVDRPVDTLSLTGYSTEFTQDSHEIPVQVFLTGGGFEQRARELRWFEMLFTYPDVANRFEKAIQTWFGRYEIVGPAINLYDGLASGGYRYLEGRFLATVQALEAFHRHSYPDQRVMLESDFTELVDSIANAVHEERRQWLRQQIEHANEPSLRKRLEELIKPFRGLFGTKSQRRRFVGTVVDTRNSFVHTAVAKSSLADDPAALYRLQQKLEALFQLHLLKLLDFSDEEIKKMAEKESIDRKLR